MEKTVDAQAKAIKNQCCYGPSGSNGKNMHGVK